MGKTRQKIRDVLKHIKESYITLHHMVWGKGWKRFTLAVVVSLLVIVILLTISLEVTSTPRFCSVCHNMKPYYESWKQSSHRDVTCTACHFPPVWATS